jgi:hypothetical protein
VLEVLSNLKTKTVGASGWVAVAQVCELMGRANLAFRESLALLDTVKVLAIAWPHQCNT